MVAEDAPGPKTGPQNAPHGPAVGRGENPQAIIRSTSTRSPPAGPTSAAPCGTPIRSRPRESADVTKTGRRGTQQKRGMRVRSWNRIGRSASSGSARCLVVDGWPSAHQEQLPGYHRVVERLTRHATTTPLSTTGCRRRHPRPGRAHVYPQYLDRQRRPGVARATGGEDGGQGAIDGNAIGAPHPRVTVTSRVMKMSR